MARLFLAVWPPQDVIAALHELPCRDEVGVRWVAPEAWHITLRFLGDADPAEVDACLEGLSLPPAEAVLGPVVSRLGRSVIVVPVRGLDELAATVEEATVDIGSFEDSRPFAGHLTLARLRNCAACGVAGAPFAARFAVREIALVSSVTANDGPRYTTTATWPVPPP